MQWTKCVHRCIFFSIAMLLLFAFYMSSYIHNSCSKLTWSTCPHFVTKHEGSVVFHSTSDISRMELVTVEGRHGSSESSIGTSPYFQSTKSNNASHLINPQSSYSVQVQDLSNITIGDHHIYSAYYDSRSLSYRPAIILFGYARMGSKSPLYCYFKYDDNSTKCLKQTVVQTPLIARNIWPTTYFCRMKPGDRIPTHVMVSSASSCDAKKWSSPIPVLNRERKEPREFGVCVEGCMWTTDGDNERVFRLALEFLAMVKTLGASTVTMYSRNINQAVLEKILLLYPDLVEILNWPDLNGTLHFYGQRILINDCVYRNMYKVKYLVIMDLDEMIYPVSTNSWSGMLHALEENGKFASYTFSNNFIEELPQTTIWDTQNCTHLKTVKYFERLKLLPWPDFKKKTKMKVIVKPDLISTICIHDVCKTTVNNARRTHWVSRSVGYMAHYRVPVPPYYVYGKGVENRTPLRFKDKVIQELRRSCCKLANCGY